MRKIIFTMVMSLCMVAAYAQLKVVSSGDILVKNTGLATTTADLDIPDHNSNRNNFQAGSFGIQSFAFNNGFLAGNSYFDLAQGGNKMVLRNTGKGAMAQFFDGRIIYRTVPQGNAGQAVVINDAFVVQNNAKVQIGYPWPFVGVEKLEVNGNIALSGIVIASDRRLKKNSSEFKYGLSEVLQLNPINFQYNGQAGITDEAMHVGLYAQELRKLVPELVTEFEHEEFQITNNIVGEFRKTGKKETYYRIKDNEVKYLLVNAIKEQQEIIEDKEERITDLEDKLLALEEKVSAIINQYDVNLGAGLSDAGALGQNIPNPFNGETQIVYSIPEKSTSAQINIFDLNGRMLKTIPIQHTGKGRLNVTADQLPAGTYSYQLVIDNEIIGAKKMVLAK